MKLIFIDTEFSDFINTDLISIGAVTEDGSKEFYCELTDFNKKVCSEFVREAVLPQLDFDKFGMCRHVASAKFYQWLEELGDEYALCPDYSADWECALDLLEDLPSNISKSPIMYFTQLNTLILEKADEMSHHSVEWVLKAKNVRTKAFLDYFEKNPFPKQHHALADAKANRESFIATLDWLKLHTF